MKQIIPFKKELLFKTKVSEITSISLEHTLSLKNDDLISGEFHVTGDYKMTDGSINREKFMFKLPFDITLDSRYDMDSVVIDIDNFYYEIVNNEALQVNIDVYVEGKKIVDDDLVVKEEVLEESLTKEDDLEVFSTSSEDRTDLDDTFDLFKEEFEPATIVSKSDTVALNLENDKVSDSEFNLFDNIDGSDTYVTYYVYIVKEEDNLEKILSKYNVTKEEMALYNNLDNINPGTKLIIPSSCNE